MTNVYEMREASTYNQDIAAMMPKGEIWNLAAIKEGHSEAIGNFRVVRVAMPDGKIHFVSCPRQRYRLIQHEAAFHPIKEGMTLAGITNFKYVMWATPNRAGLQIYADSDADNYDGVQLGFSVTNSLDGSLSLRYGVSMSKVSRYWEIVGYRQVCSNGLKIRVPLDQAEIIRPELVVKIRALFKESTKMKHTESIHAKMEGMQYVVEALTLLKEPVANMIKAGQAFKIESEDKLKQLIKLHVGNRFKTRVLRHYRNDGEGNNLWSLVNALTASASHDEDLTPSNREALIDKAADLLLVAVAK